jgi:hypothetical protein
VPPCAKARAEAAQETLDAAPDADAKEAVACATLCIADGPPSAELAKSARAMLVQSGAVYAERGRLQLAVTAAKTELDTAAAAAAMTATLRDTAEGDLAAAQAELESVVAGSSDVSASLPGAGAAAAAASASASASCAAGAEEDPESVAGSASSARARFNAAVQAESDALAGLSQAQSGGASTGATLASLTAAQRDILDKIREIEQLIRTCGAQTK